MTENAGDLGGPPPQGGPGTGGFEDFYPPQQHDHFGGDFNSNNEGNSNAGSWRGNRGGGWR